MCFPQIETGPSRSRFGDTHKKMWLDGRAGVITSSNRKVVCEHIEYECSPVYGTRGPLSSPACIGDHWAAAGEGMYGGTGNIYAGKKRWNAVAPSAVLTKTSLFLPARMQRDLCPLWVAWNVQELSSRRGGSTGSGEDA